MRLANGIVIDKEATFGALKFSALRREVHLQNCLLYTSTAHIQPEKAPKPLCQNGLGACFAGNGNH